MLFQRDSAGHQKNQEITKNIGKPAVVCGEAAEIPLAVSNCGECFQIAGVIYQLCNTMLRLLRFICYIFRTEGSSHTKSSKCVGLLNLSIQMLRLCDLWINNKHSDILNAIV